MSIVAALAVARGRAHRRVKGPSRRGRMPYEESVDIR